MQFPTGGKVRDRALSASADPVKLRDQQLQSGWKKMSAGKPRVLCALLCCLFTLEKSKHPGCFQTEKGVFYYVQSQCQCPFHCPCGQPEPHPQTDGDRHAQSAVAFLLMFIEFPIPALIPAFVKLDVSDLPELLAAFSLGPVYGVAGCPAEEPAVSGAPWHLLRLCGRGVQLHHGRRVRLLCRVYLSARTSPGRVP